jgi:hypothetical protein
MEGVQSVQRRSWHREFFSFFSEPKGGDPMHALVVNFPTSVSLCHFDLSMSSTDDCLVCAALVPSNVDPDTLNFRPSQTNPTAMFPAPSLAIWLGLVSAIVRPVSVSKTFTCDAGTSLFFYLLLPSWSEGATFSCSFSVNVSS